MRETATYIKCDGDGCTTMAKVVNEAETPQGWLRVWEAKEGSLSHAKNGSHSFDLCSLRCVERWAKGRRKFLGQMDGANSKENKTREAIVDAMTTLDEAISVHDLAVLTGYTTTGIRSNVDRLVAEGQVEIVREAIPGNSKNPALYKLATVRTDG